MILKVYVVGRQISYVLSLGKTNAAVECIAQALVLGVAVISYSAVLQVIGNHRFYIFLTSVVNNKQFPVGTRLT